MRAAFALLACLLPLAGCLTLSDGPMTARPPGVVYGATPGVVYGAAPGVVYGAGPRAAYGAAPGFWAFGPPRAYGWGDGRGYGDSRYRGRSFRPSGKVVCDRATQICYKRGDVDKSETKAYFGSRAAGRADDLRDRYETDELLVRRRAVVCNRDDEVCYKRGRPDRSETRDVFGKKAARRL
jgi:hypothetical protein